MAYKSDLVDIEVIKEHETDLAWLVYDGDKKVWVPKKWGELVRNEFSEGQTKRTYTLTLPQDKAEKLELV